MKIYMAVTNDKYELPVAVTTNAAAMAKICGLTEGSVLSSISKGNVCRKLNAKIIRLEIEDE